MKRLTNGVAMPSLRPLSTLRSRRTPEGTRSSPMMEAPRAASVGATMAPIAAATHSPLPPKSSAAAPAPAPMVSGRPMPRRRAGSAASVRSARTFTREASAKSTRARVISASERMVEEWRLKWMRAVGPWVTTRPRRTNAIGAETSQRSNRAETRPQTRTQAETTASTVRLRSWFICPVPLSTPRVVPGQGRKSRPRAAARRGGEVGCPRTPVAEVHPSRCPGARTRHCGSGYSPTTDHKEFL